MKGFYSVRKNKCIHTNSFSSVGQSIITLLYFTFPISSIALVRFQEATFSSYRSVQNLDTNSAGSCAKFYEFLCQT